MLLRKYTHKDFIIVKRGSLAFGWSWQCKAFSKAVNFEKAIEPIIRHREREEEE